jgi:hypothetical protein
MSAAGLVVSHICSPSGTGRSVRFRLASRHAGEQVEHFRFPAMPSFTGRACDRQFVKACGGSQGILLLNATSCARVSPG